jgi:CDP-diacylglycerol--glycerol-3-phosphate 3-phosphatidyltransferase
LKDIQFAFVLAGLTATALTTFGWRVVRKGAVRFDRVDSVGGSALLSKHFVEMGYWCMTPLARACARVKLTPNHLTAMSLVLGLGAGAANAVGWFGMGALISLGSVLADVLDGQVARLTKTGSPAGEVFDAAADRYTELAYVGGLVVFYRDLPLAMAFALAALSACFMVSYSTAKAEAMHIDPPRAPMRRHERAAYLISGAGLSSLFAGWLDPQFHVHGAPLLAAVIIIAVVGNYSAVKRFYLTYLRLKSK